MVACPRGKASMGSVLSCRCRSCKENPGLGRKQERRRLKRRERQAWKGHGRRRVVA